MPEFNGDQLEEARSGGDLSVQACADDPQVAFHAVRQLARAGRRRGPAALDADRVQRQLPPPSDTPRNLMGFKDGTQNPIAERPREKAGGVTQPNPLSPEEVVWVGQRGPGLDARAAATWSCAASAWRWSIGTAPTSNSRSRRSAGTNTPARRSAARTSSTRSTSTQSTTTAIR